MLTLNRFSADEPTEAATYEQEAVHTAVAEEEEHVPMLEEEDEDDHTPFVLTATVAEEPQTEASTEEDVW